MKKMMFTMTVTYDENEIALGNPLHELEHELYNIDGIVEWDSNVVFDKEVNYQTEEE